MKHPLLGIVENQKKGIPSGIYSACTASELVIEAVMEKAKEHNEFALIEATANQVNQYGGYTDMRPRDYVEFVFHIAERVGFPKDRIILGGDHLGPLTWMNLTEAEAMEKSKVLIWEYVLAGFTKIHIDTSMKVADDAADSPLDTKVIAERGAILCAVAEEAYRELKELRPDAVEPVYVIGSEVPIPGGAQEEEEGIAVTQASDFEATVKTFENAYAKYKLEDAFKRVLAVVVQPGVEFGDESVHEYDRKAAEVLVSSLRNYPGLVFEGHSTDYQTKHALREMVEDGIAILKVGPALTFALREGLFALNYIERELFKYNADVEQSNFIDVLEAAMVRNPSNWKKHYHGSPASIKYARKYSYSDRCRYYLPVEEVKEAMDRMIGNLKAVKMPLTLIHQFMPVQYDKIRNGQLKNDPETLVKDWVGCCIEDYLYACSAEKQKNNIAI